MNLKNKFCCSVDIATFTPPLTEIPGSAPRRPHGEILCCPCFKMLKTFYVNCVNAHRRIGETVEIIV